MADTNDDEIEKFTRGARELSDSLNQVMNHGAHTSSQNVTINGSTVSLFVSAVAIFAIVFSMASVAVIWAWRDRDLDDMAQIRVRLNTCEQYREQHTRRLNELEKRENGT